MESEDTKGHFIRHGPCPECHSKDNVAVYSSGYETCHSDGCDYWKKGDMNYIPSNEEKQKKQNPEFILDGTAKALSSRRLDQKTCEFFSYENTGKYQVAQYFSPEGDLVAQHLRDKDKNFPWIGDRKKAQLFGQHLWKPGGKSLVITEGEIDCMSFAQVQNLTWPTISISSGVGTAVQDCTKQYEFINSFAEVYLAFDADKQGQEAASKVAEIFPAGKVKVVHYPPDCKDASDVLVKHGAKKLISCKWEARPYRPDGIVTLEDMPVEELLKSNETSQSYDCQYPELNRRLRGLHKGSLLVSTAYSGKGKSTLVNELGFHLHEVHGCKVAVLALEEDVKFTAVRWIALKLGVHSWDLWDNPGIVPQEDYIRAYNELLESKRWWSYNAAFSDLDPTSIISKIEYLASAVGVDFVILDHLSIIVSGNESSRDGERKDIDMMMTKLRAVAHRTGVGIMAVVHLRKPPNNHDDDSPLSQHDLRGSGSIAQLSDAVIGVSRKRLEVLKCRRTGLEGPADSIQYSLETGRLIAVADEDMFSDNNESSNDSEDF